MTRYVQNKWATSSVPHLKHGDREKNATTIKFLMKSNKQLQFWKKIKILRKKFLFIILVHLIPFEVWIFWECIWYDHIKQIKNNTSRMKKKTEQSGFVFSLEV